MNRFSSDLVGKRSISAVIGSLSIVALLLSGPTLYHNAESGLDQIFEQTAWNAALAGRKENQAFTAPVSHIASQSPQDVEKKPTLTSLILTGISGQVSSRSELTLVSADLNKNLTVGDVITLPLGEGRTRLFKVIGLKSENYKVENSKSENKSACTNPTGAHSDIELLNCGVVENNSSKKIKYIIELVPQIEKDDAALKVTKNQPNKL